MAGMAEEAMAGAMLLNTVFKGILAVDITMEATVDEAVAVGWVVEDLEEDSNEISEAAEIQEASIKAALVAQNDSKTTHSGTKTSKTSGSGRLPPLFAFAPDIWRAFNLYLPKFTCTFSNFVNFPSYQLPPTFGKNLKFFS